MKDLELEPVLSRSSRESPQEIHFRITSFSRQWVTRPHLWRPPTDFYETDTHYCARVEIAGMQNAELNIAIDNRSVAIYGHRQPPVEQAAYYQLEIRYGEFLSTLELPGEVDIENVQANYSDGFLLVKFPRAGNR